jgi:hypothetical protein
MQLTWLSYPITQIGALAVMGAGLAASLLLWISAKFELRGMRRRLQKAQETFEADMRNLTASVDAIRAAKQEAPEPVPVTVTQSLNLTKRAQVLRMHNRGESVHSIAAALQIPSGEVSLLLKIERLAEAEPAGASR